MVKRSGRLKAKCLGAYFNFSDSVVTNRPAAARKAGRNGRVGKSAPRAQVQKANTPLRFAIFGIAVKHNATETAPASATELAGA
jgi:hypothetical protein